MRTLLNSLSIEFYMKKQCHYITRAYWNLRRRKPQLITNGVYELCRRSRKYNLRSYYFDKDETIVKNFNKKRRSSLLDPKVIIKKGNKQRKTKKNKLYVHNVVTDSVLNNTVNTNNFIPKDNISDTTDLEVGSESDFGSESSCGIDANWNDFNKFHGKQCEKESDNWVSATKIANYLLKDPVLDWYKLYFRELQYNNTPESEITPTDVKTITNNVTNNATNDVDNSDSCLKVLFEMGNKFEDKVIEYLRAKFSGQVKKVQTGYVPLDSFNMKLTKQFMLEGVPIIEQAPLRNETNKTFGVADLLVRSDWINKIIDFKPLTSLEETHKAPYLNGEYHYIVIDIKWTTINLCADGLQIKNSGRFPAYKGQLAIYNAILGQLQGYTPPKAYILAKSYKYTTRGNTIHRYNCFDVLGHIDYSNFDKQYIDYTGKATSWIRNLRSNGNTWSLIPPSIKELYPNMCNSYDSGFKKQKKHQSNEIKELTSIYMVGHRNRIIGHENGIYRYDDPHCKASKLGINGQKIAPIVNQMIKMENNKDPLVQIRPRVISNDMYGWQTKIDIEFFVDFEMLNTQFYTKEINLTNSRGVTDFLFMIGVGYEEHDKFNYKCFYADEITPICENTIVTKFIQFIEEKVASHMKLYNIKNRSLCFPKIFHWSPAEKSTLTHVSSRHNDQLLNKINDVILTLSSWEKNVTWVDFCKVFKEEPIILKGVKEGFGLKGIAKQMYKNGWIGTNWQNTGPSDGLGAMMDACKYYKEKTKYKQMFAEIIKYNCVDCKVIWEIVNYLRNNHANETFKQQRIDGHLIDQYGDAKDDMMMFPEAIEDDEYVN